jgi:UDP-3-O-[3-hydroxymyristoyl] glucosamine N-acyltransferase
MPRFTLGELAALTGGRIAGDANRVVERALPPAESGPDDITFALDLRAHREFLRSKAGAVVLPEAFDRDGRDAIVTSDPRIALAAILGAFHPEDRPPPGVDASAVVHPSAKLAARVHVGPNAVVERDVTLGEDVIVGAGSFVGAGSSVGDRTRLHPHVVLYSLSTIGRGCILHAGAVIGADGFGYTRSGGRHVKIPQVGGVVIGDDVEIGANACVDRGTMTPTRIGSNTKVDNLVQIGHNSEIGQRVIICGQCAIAGSTTIADDVVLAGQVGVAGHLSIGRGAVAAAGTGITSDVEPGARVAGHPPMPLEDWRRAHAALRHLPRLRTLVRSLQHRLDTLEGGDSPPVAPPAPSAEE